MPRPLQFVVPSFAFTALLFVSGCGSFTEKRSYVEQLSQIPAPVSEGDWLTKCSMLSDELAKQQTLVSLGADRKNVEAVQSRQKDFSCASGFARAAPPPPPEVSAPSAAPAAVTTTRPKSAIESCIEACKANTPRTPEQCFDACNH